MRSKKQSGAISTPALPNTSAMPKTAQTTSLVITEIDNSSSILPVAEAMRHGMARTQDETRSDPIAKHACLAAVITFNSEISASPWQPITDIRLEFDPQSLRGGTRGFAAIRHGRLMMIEKLKELSTQGIHVPLALQIVASDFFFTDNFDDEQKEVHRAERDFPTYHFLAVAVGEVDVEVWKSWWGKMKGVNLSDLTISSFFKVLSRSIKAASRSRPGDKLSLEFDDLAK